MRWGEMCVWGAYPRGGLVPHIYIWARVAPGRVVLGEALQRGCRLNFASDLGYDPGCDPVPTTCPRLSLVGEPGEARPPRRSIRLLGPVSAPRSPAGRVHCVVECSFLPAQLRGACGGPSSSVFLQGGLRRGAFRWRGPGLWSGHQGIPRNVYVRGLPGCLESAGWCFLVVEVGAGATPRHNGAGYA